MSNSKISYLNISPYSRQSPSQLKTELKRNLNSVERPKSSKSAYAASSSRGNTPINNPEGYDRKHSPFVDRKNELMASLYNIAKTTKAREKPSTAKGYSSKGRENSSSSKKLIKGQNKPADKINEKLQIYSYLHNKSSKKADESKSFSQPLSYTPSRSGSRSQVNDDKDQSNERRILEASILQQKQLIEALEEMHRSRNKPSAYSNNQNNLANLLKSAQRPPTSTPAKGVGFNNASASIGSVGKNNDDRRKSDSKRGEIFKDLRINMNQSDIVQSQKNQKSAAVSAQASQKENIQQKRHRRGLSSGQNPLFVDQQMALEQQIAMEQQRAAIEQQRAMEQMAREQERQKQMQLQLEMQQQMQQMQQMQQHMQQQYARDPQQEEDEYYEQFFHMDRMTFDFERLVISQKLNRQQNSTPNTDQNRNKPPTASGQSTVASNNVHSQGHARTRSIEDPNSFMPTKSSSRWTTKRSSMGEEPQLEQKSVGNFISDLERTDVEKEEIRRYYK